MTPPRPVLAVVGNGMVGLRFVEEALAAGLGERFQIVVFGEEPRPAYDRVHLSSHFDDDAEDLTFADAAWYADQGVELRLGVQVVELDPAGRRITGSDGTVLEYERCVLATGSSPFVPPIPGTDAAGVFVYRTIEDLEAMRAWAIAGCTTAAVVGGGLLGLEAANAMQQLGLATTVVEMAPRLMAVQLDDGAGAALRRKVEALGIEVRTSVGSTAVRTSPDGRAIGLELGDEVAPLDAELVVFAAGIRPRDQLGRDAGLAIGERGGIVIDDGCATSDPAIYAVGEVACHAGRVHGLVAPGYEMATVAARRIAGDDAACFSPTEPATKLKLLGIDVAVAGASEGVDALVVDDPVVRHLPQARARCRRRGDRPAAGRRRRSVRVAVGPGPGQGARPGERAGAAARRRRRGRRRHGLLVPQRERHRHPRGHPGGRPRGRRRDQGLHQGGHRLRLVHLAHRPHARRGAPRSPARRSTGGCASTSPSPARSCSRSSGSPGSARSPSWPGASAPAGAAPCASRRWPRCSPRWRRATCSTGSRPRSRTPTTTSSPTSSATAPTRWCPGCPAARSPPRA